MAPFDFFALQKKSDNLDRHQIPIPKFDTFSSVIEMDVCNSAWFQPQTSVLEKEFVSIVPKSSIEVHHRASVPRSAAPANESMSIFSTFARSSILQPSIRLSSSCALYEDEFSPLPTDYDDSLDRAHLRSSNASSLKSSVHSDLSSEKSKKPSASTISQPDLSVEKKTPPPIPQAAKPSVEKKAPPPPPPQSAKPVAKQDSWSSRGSEASNAEPAASYRPPVDFLAEIRQKGAERMARSKEETEIQSIQSIQSASSAPSPAPSPAPSSDSPAAGSAPPSRPLPASFLAEIRQKGAERMARSKEETDVSEPSKAVSDKSAKSPSAPPIKPASSAPAPPPKPLPADFLAEIRQKGAERLARSKENEPSEPSEPSEPREPDSQPPRPIPSTASAASAASEGVERPARALPAGFLAEIRAKGAARQEALQQKHERKSSQGTLGSKSSTLGSRSGTIRRNGTLGGNSGSKRYGKFVMHEIRSGQNTLKVCEDGEKSQVPKSGGNPLLDEIRNFNLANLRKVDKSKSRKDTQEKKPNQEPSLADLMRSRLECFDSDSNTDSDDSRFDFSD